jgi:predicted HTH transcriptional regulator
LNQLISNAASQHVRPPLHPQTDNVQTAQGLVLVVSVQDGLNKTYMDLQGRVWVKSGADKRHVTAREEMQRMFQRGGLLQADQVPVRNATEADIDERAFGCYFERGMAFIKRSLHKMQAGRGCKQIRTDVSNRRNQVLAEHAAHILPYRGMGTGVPRALYAWPQIDLVDKPEINQFRAVVWRAVASTEATTPDITPEVAHEVGRLLQVLVGEMSRAHAAPGDAL